MYASVSCFNVHRRSTAAPRSDSVDPSAPNGRSAAEIASSAVSTAFSTT